MESFSRDGLQLAYEVSGDPSDRPVLLIHGLGADHGMWQPQIERYPEEGYSLIVPDVRGHGESESASQFTIEDCAADLAELLTERDVPNAAVCGVSMGGVIAQQLAIDYPDLVRVLVLADTFSSVRGPVARLNARAGEIGLSLLPGLLQWKIVESHFDAPEQAELREYFRTMLFRTDPAQLKKARRAVNRFDCLDELASVDAPALVLVGENNGEWFVNLARETAAGIDGAEFQVLPEGSDPSNLTVPAAFDESVLSFLEQTD